MFARAAICLMLLFFAGAAFAQDAKNRVALVIGNAASPTRNTPAEGAA
jgi:hypothetical protein